MNPSAAASLPATTVDKDLAEQAHPGHGVPSQDPASAAQFPLAPGEAEREAKSVLVGGGVLAGAATGATLGVVLAGPVGVVVGGTLGAVVGVLGATAAGSMLNPQSVSSADTVHSHTEGSADDGRLTAQEDKVSIEGKLS